MDRRQAILGLAGAAAMGWQARPARGEDFPTRPLKTVVPYAPGATDQEVRAVCGAAEKFLRQPIQVENRPGGGATIGANAVAISKPDGYTMLYASSAVLTIAPAMRKLPYSYDDLEPVAQVTAHPHLLAARADAPFKTLQEMVAYGKANPGSINFGSSGTGSSVHLAGEAFARAAGIKFNHIPFAGLTPAITAALGGNVDVVIGLPILVMPQVEAGKLRAIVQMGATRSPVIPEVPTAKENGIDLDLSSNQGFFAPKGLPHPIRDRLSAAIEKAVASEEFQSFARKNRISTRYASAAEFKATIDHERGLMKQLVASLDLAKQ